MLPASLGRHVRNLEESLGTELVARTTRHVSLTEAGSEVLEEARDLVERADRFEEKPRNRKRSTSLILRVGSIDSASAGLMPQLLTFFRAEHPEVQVTMLEQKTIRLLPRLLSGRLDGVRPPAGVSQSEHRLSIAVLRDGGRGRAGGSPAGGPGEGGDHRSG
jgi:DNA-binding transcriptional LysR family regulator